MKTSDVCPKCGWYESKFIHDRQCDPEAGAKADRLSERIREALPFVTTTKLGYGNGILTFEIDGDTNIRFRITPGIVQFADLFYLENLDPDDVLALVEALQRVRNRRKEYEARVIEEGAHAEPAKG